SVYGAIHDGDPTPDLLAIKYLEALGTVADGQATKIFLPADMSATLGSLGAIAELFTGDEPEGDRPEASAQDAAPAEPEDPTD
ncbi:MAG: SPFH/Band 7/PHB domain protein, partial [Actinomycetota bacterium]|nr:SPFH/Band 7/PHB domain protein [Actinomycetota bacterium]